MAEYISKCAFASRLTRTSGSADERAFAQGLVTTHPRLGPWRAMTQLSRSYLLPAGETRLKNAVLPFKVLADDSGGAISICEFVLPSWSSGPVLHRHDGVDEGFFVVSGRLEFLLDDVRRPAEAGDFAWVPRGTAHTFACAGDDPVHVVAFACPGGIEHLFAEQHAYLSSLDGPPDPKVLDEMGVRHGAPTLGPPITASNAPHGAS